MAPAAAGTGSWRGKIAKGGVSKIFFIQQWRRHPLLSRFPRCRHGQTGNGQTGSEQTGSEKRQILHGSGVYAIIKKRLKSKINPSLLLKYFW